MKKIISILSLVAIAAVFSGCGTLDKMYDQKVVAVPGGIVATNTVWTTNTVLVMVTNTVAVPAATNPVTGVVTPASITEIATPTIRQVAAPQITYDYAPTTYITNLVEKPLIGGGIQAVTGIASATGIPWGGLAGIVLAWLYTGYAALRNKKLAVALTTGIEAGRVVLQTTPEGQALDKIIKAKLIEHQELAGVLNDASKLVNQYTNTTTGPVLAPVAPVIVPVIVKP